MADIRINALATTAASTASDDYIAIDGSANGTRKLNAYSPTFGGNLTVSGTGTSSFSGTVKILGPTNYTRIRRDDTVIDFTNAAENAYADGQIVGNTIAIKGNNGTGLTIGTSGQGTLAGNLTVSGTGTSSVAGKLIAGSATADYAVSKLQSNGALVVYGGAITNAPDAPSIVIDQQVGGVARIMASGTSTWAVPLCVNPYGGNVLIGTTTDGGQKLQVNGSGRFSGNVHNSNTFGFISYGPNGSDTGARIWCFTDGAAYIDAGATTGASAGQLVLRTGGGLLTALTLDSSQRCILAGALRLNNAYVAGAPTATGYVTLQDSAGNTYKVLVGT